MVSLKPGGLDRVPSALPRAPVSDNVRTPGVSRVAAGWYPFPLYLNLVDI